MNGQPALIRLCGIAKTYDGAGEPVHALCELALDFFAGHFVAIMGPSGSGKSTLLNLLGMLDRPSAGAYLFGDRDVAGLDDDTLSAFRCRSVGMVFQSFNLLSHLTVLDNVCVPMQYADVEQEEMRERAAKLVDKVGLGDRIYHRPTQLSGGQCQRVAIARALANNPPLILADEPTGNLDERTGMEILRIFHELCAGNRTVIMVTHNPEYRSVVERTVVLHDGRITEDTVAGGAA